MSGWAVHSLVDVVTLQRGHDLPTKERSLGSVPIIGSFGVTGTHDSPKYAAPGVAIGRSGASIGVATWCDEPFWPLNTCLFVKDFKGNDPRWVYYFLHAMDFTGFNSGSAQPSLNRNFIARVPVPLPPLEEQRGITATLGALDDKIDSNRRAIRLLHELLDSRAAEYAKRLPSKRLGDIANVLKKSVNPTMLEGALVDHYSLPAFDEGRRPEQVSASEIKSSKNLIEQPCILISRLNPRFNRTWWVAPHPERPALASTEFLAIAADTDEELATLWLAVRGPEFREQLPQRVTGTSGSHQRIRPKDLLDVPVPKANYLGEWERAEALAFLEKAEQLRAENQKLAALRDTLLPELLSGRIRVPEAEEAVSAA